MTKYNTEFKMELVKEYFEGNVSYKDLTKEYSILDKYTVRRWVNSYESQVYEELKETIEEYIKYYIQDRIKERLGYLNPIEYREKNAA